MVKKILGYVLSGIGLIGLASSGSDVVKEKVFGFLPDSISGLIGPSLLIISIALLGIGVFILILNGRSGRIKQSNEEVPIYEGTGKHRKIVGYRKG